ncbi:hypothetical protein, partial [Mobiluncus holmesii]|uniref:hypothetical protein n=1 Tax=Mobiluncus holmesii TaxID=144178 RepID=UPI001B7FA09B
GTLQLRQLTEWITTINAQTNATTKHIPLNIVSPGTHNATPLSNATIITSEVARELPRNIHEPDPRSDPPLREPSNDEISSSIIHLFLTECPSHPLVSATIFRRYSQ